MWYITRRTIRLMILAWGPVLAAMILLFVASAQPKYGPPAGATVDLYFSGAIPMFPGPWDVLVKKGGHVIAYGVLGLLMMRALALWGMPYRRAAYLAVALTIGYAISDELHQALVPGRFPSPVDVGLDFLGAALFTLVARHFYLQRSAPS